MLSTWQIILIMAVSFAVSWAVTLAVMVYKIYDLMMAGVQLFLVEHGHGQIPHQNETVENLAFRLRLRMQLLMSLLLAALLIMAVPTLWVKPMLFGMFFALLVRVWQEFGYNIQIGVFQSYDSEWTHLAYFTGNDDEVFDIPIRQNDGHENLQKGAYYASFEALFYVSAMQLDHLKLDDD